jgi:ABC-type nitrate/sulfonate/bicarbonate transport system permease component
MLVGTGLAVAAWFSPVAAGLLNPLTVLFSSVPVVALIPVIARLLGYDTSTVLAIVVIITFFPSFVFASSGLRSPPPGAEDLFRVLGASRLSVLWRLALPAAMPNLAIAFKLAAAHAILAAMVAEFLMGTSGLGYLFAKTKSDFQTEQAFGASAVATVISATAFLLAGWVERRVRERYA